MKTRHTLPADTWQVTMYAHCGMKVPIADGLSELDALERVLRYVDRRVKRGYEATELGPGRFELTEPEDSMLVPDDAGIIAAERDTVPAWECRECGDIVPIGSSCTCIDEEINRRYFDAAEGIDDGD